MTRLTHICDVTHSHMWHDSLVYVCTNSAKEPYKSAKEPYINLQKRSIPIWSTRMCFICARDMTHWYTCVPITARSGCKTGWHYSYYSFISVTCLIRTRDMAHWYMCVPGAARRNRMPWLIHICDVPHSHMWRDPLIYVCTTCSEIRIQNQVTWLIYLWLICTYLYMTYLYIIYFISYIRRIQEGSWLIYILCILFHI